MKKLFSVWLAALLCLVGCTNEEIANVPIKKGSIQATFENQSSRLAVGEGNALTWSEGDAFKMFNVDGLYATWTLEGAGGTDTGTFGTTDNLEGTLKGAAFPASAVTSLSENTLTMTLPGELTYQAGICNLPMWASCSSLDAAISFKHLGALLKIDFKDIPAGYNQLIVTADKPLAGTFTADLSNEEPVLVADAQNVVHSIMVNFTASESKQNKLFYLPLPVGTYGSINVSVSDGSNTLSIADWANRTIVRKKVYLASLTYKTTDATTTEGIKEALGASKTVSLEVTEKITDVTAPVTLPENAVKVGLNFAEVPETASDKPLTITETTVAEGAELNISIPSSETADSHLTLDVPSTTVTVESGNYKRIVATTAANTLVLGADVKVEELVVKAGNVILDGAEVKKISRHAETSDVIYVFVKGTSTLAADVLDEGVQEPDYLTFKAETAQTLTMSKAVETLEYSVGGAAWAELGTATVEFGPAGDLRVRGKSAMGTAASDKDYATVTFGNEASLVAASGDIRTLVDYESYTSDALDTSNARFVRLFAKCKVLTSAPALPATTLAEKCYFFMFNDCSALTEAPVLPATTATTSCYERMFMGCTALTEAPTLPATTLAYRCYGGMFQNCKALVMPPALPATALASSCYNSMFANCSVLASAPALPATIMMESCYSGMFTGCASLTEAPALPATTLANSCYFMMLANCTSLTEAPALPATTLANGCYRLMFTGCTSLTEAPALPATTMMENCYNGMFSICRELTEAPVLPATTLAEKAYYSMFESCKKLNTVTMLATDITANECLTNWLKNTAATGTFYGDGNVTDFSAYGIPEGWEVKDYDATSAQTYQIRYTSTDGNIVTPNSNATFGANIVSNTYENGVGIIEFDGPVTTIGYNRIGWEETGAFSRCETLKSIEIPNTVTNIDAYAFYQCTELQDVTLPDKITAIKEFTFTNNSLESVVIPDGVTSIAARAFLYNMKLTSVTLPKELVTIGESAFAWCNALPSVTIPEKVTSIGRGAFINNVGEGESALTTVYCKAVNPPTIDAESQIFGSSSTITIYVPANSLSAYTAQWGNLTYSFSYTIEASTEY